MPDPFRSAAYAVLALYALWICYLAVMNLARARDAGTLTLPARILGWPLVGFAWLLDVAVNVGVMSVLLLEVPRWGEWTVTARLKRHVRGTGWRQKVAAWMGIHLLNAFDPDGTHL